MTQSDVNRSRSRTKPGAAPDTSVSRDAFLYQSRDYHAFLKESLVTLRSSNVSGTQFVQAYSRVVDLIVKVVFQRAAEEAGIDPKKADIAIIGVGGYGRAELAPFSDVDILVLCKRKTSTLMQMASTFIRLMWDVGFELGHSIHSLVESASVPARNMDTKTALIESRTICGSNEISRAIEQQISVIRKKNREAFLKRKIRDVLTRHAKHGESYQLIEPNVKMSPGGLRDFQTLLWMGMVTLGGRKDTSLQTLRRKKLLLKGEKSALERAYDFLLRIRVELHLATQSKQDQLTVRMQKIVAETLDYGRRGDHLGVELFMKDYYGHTRVIYHVIGDVLEELGFGRNVGILLGRKGIPADGATLSLRVSRKKIKREPLYVFEHQKITGLKLDRALKRRLEDILKSDLTDSSDTRRLRRNFPSLLDDGRNTALMLRSMQDTGFLDRIIPEYSHLACLKRYDLYHSFTADEHSFRVVENIEMLATSRPVRPDPLARLYSEISEKQVLFLAALLHDIGKIEGRGHAKKGAVLSEKILKRLGLKKETRKLICFLIEHHLLMAHFSQRRDPTDIGTIQTFCSRVKNRTNLKFLCLLTYADLKATSPLVWTKWKQNLLWGLYLKAYQFMAKKEKQPTAVYQERKKKILRAFPAGGAREKALSHLDLLPGRYLLTMSPPQVKQHLDLVESLNGEKGVVAMRKRGPSTEFTFCTIDKPFRLAQLCGVLAVNDFNILYAFAFTRTDGKVIDIFQVEDLTGTNPIDANRLERLQASLALVVEGKEDIDSLFVTHIAKWKRKKETAIPIPLRVEFENDLSGDFTIIDIFAPDEPGLLYRITRALSSEGLTIYRARISTEANKAIDAFYVQDRKGNKIKSAYRLKNIRNRLAGDIGQEKDPKKVS
jgi:[protein-PII] uridylyltransferase